MKKSILRSLFLASGSLSAALMSGCVVSGGGGSAYYGPAWYDVYGNYCNSGNPSPGCNYYGDGAKIVAGEDPYYVSSSLAYGRWDFYDSWGYPASFYGWAWQSPTGVIYDEFGTALNNDSESSSNDLISNVADRERDVVLTVGKKFAERYALAEDTGVRIASTLNDWATLSKKQQRARTAKDVADFSVRLYGLSADKAKAALDQAKKGSMAGLEAANSEVATYWGTSPETSKTILKSWYKKQLSDSGIRQ